MARVSVVLPVRFVNFDWLQRSISSVLEQDHSDFELIVVNDDATENIDDLISSFGIMKYVKNDRNRKIPYSLNRGFELADGEYHTTTSADNYMLPGMLRRLVEELEWRRDLAAVCGKSIIVDQDDAVLDLPSAEVGSARLSGCDHRDGYIERRYTYYSTLGACFLYRKEVWERLGGYDERRHGSEDYDFWIRASRSFKLGRIPWDEPPLFAYRVHSSSVSRTVRGCFTVARVKVLEREARLYPRDQHLRSAIEFYRARLPKREGFIWDLLRTLKQRVPLPIRS